MPRKTAQQLADRINTSGKWHVEKTDDGQWRGFRVKVPRPGVYQQICAPYWVSLTRSDLARISQGIK